ncbi:MAG TPA: metal-dependent hydrolase [Bacillales bacterium]
MDTGTHVVMGIGLGGFALLDPVVAQSPVTAEAVLTGTLIGSLVPDFDTIFKLKNNATYIRQHRGTSHSIPAMLIWPLAIVGAISIFIPNAEGLHLWLWTFAAVVLHVFVDIFNAYGTQALRPFSNKWIALGIINIFDPVIFFTHAAGIAVWFFGLGPPGFTFLTVYIILFFYYIWRIFVHNRLMEQIKAEVPDAEYVNVSPNFRWNRWHISIQTPEQFHVAEASRNGIIVFDTYKRQPLPDTPVLRTVQQDENVKAFLAFSPIFRWEKTEYPHYDEVRFIDLRYRDKDGHYPFVAIVLIDREQHIVSSFTGWVHSEDKLQKKLKPATNLNG